MYVLFLKKKSRVEFKRDSSPIDMKIHLIVEFHSSSTNLNWTKINLGQY